MRWRRNPYDSERRELERGIESGELGPVEGGDLLDALALRYGRLDYESAVGLAVVRRGSIYGWDPTWEHPGVIVLTPTAYFVPWDLVLLSSPWHNGDESTSPLAVANADSWDDQTPLRDLRTPNTGDFVRDAIYYREQLAWSISYMSAAAAAGRLGLCVCTTHVDPACPTHGILLEP